MVTTRETPTPSNTTGSRIGEGEYADSVAAQTRALWARSALLIEGVTGTNDLVGSVTPALDAPYEAGMSFWLIPLNDNTDEMTLDLGQGAEPLVKTDGDPLEEGDVFAGVLYPVTFDGTEFRIVTLATAVAEETAGIAPAVEHRTASATITIPAGATKCRVILQGGGGNGATGTADTCCNAGLGGCGGSGATLYKYLTGLTPGNTLALTVGAVAGNTTLASGTETITTLTAAGGTSGSASSAGGTGASGAGGTATNGDLNINGQPGFGFKGNSPSNSFIRGGSSLFGHGGVGSGVVSTGYGSGGAGGYNTSGGAGKAGAAIFEWYA